jgi:predicted nucleic acid-binding Zn ribbon protein
VSDERRRRPDADSGLRSLGEALPAVVSSLRSPAVGPAAVAGVTAVALGGLFRGWDDAVGPTVSAHVRPVVLDGGRLVVEVDQPGWATQLTYLAEDVLAKVRPLVAPAQVTSLEVRVKGARKPRGNHGKRPGS